MDLYHKDGSWLCQTCTTIEINWSKEDFDYEEEDKNDEIEKAYVSGATKAASQRKFRDKKQNKKKKVKEIECIDLSSDEEEEEEDEDIIETIDDETYGDDTNIFLFGETNDSSSSIEDYDPFVEDVNESRSLTNLEQSGIVNPYAESESKSDPELKESAPDESDDDENEIFILS